MRNANQGFNVGLMLTTLNPRDCGVAGSHSIAKFRLGQLKRRAIFNHQTGNPLKLGNALLLPSIRGPSLSATMSSQSRGSSNGTESLSSWHRITLPEMVSKPRLFA